MTQHIDESTYRDVATALSPKHQHTKLARAAVEFMFQELNVNPEPGTVRTAPPVYDLGTIQGFVDFLITKKGYN